jgi:hypothetical protein
MQMSSVSKDLFLAILALDSYNRGYGAGISGLSDDTNTKIGNAKVSAHSSNDTQSREFNAGFYAISYTLDKAVGSGTDGLEAGTKIISYRGTDNFFPWSDPDRGASDLTNGWLAGAGKLTAQTNLALQFYSGVTGKDTFEGAAAKTVVTGHSLGGGLAGFVSALTKVPGVGH